MFPIGKGREIPADSQTVLTLIKRLLNFSLRKGYVEAIPGTLHISIPTVDNKVTEPLTPEQARKLLQALDGEPYQTLAELAMWIFAWAGHVHFQQPGSRPAGRKVLAALRERPMPATNWAGSFTGMSRKSVCNLSCSSWKPNGASAFFGKRPADVRVRTSACAKKRAEGKKRKKSLRRKKK